jgi:hypothetical protein
MGRRLTFGLSVLAAIPLLYVVSYFVLVKAERPRNVALSGPGPFPIRNPTYHLGGSVAQVVFSPIHAVDKQLRPMHWNYDFDPAGVVFP